MGGVVPTIEELQIEVGARIGMTHIWDKNSSWLESKQVILTLLAAIILTHLNNLLELNIT